MVNTSISPAYFLDEMSWMELDPVLNSISEKHKNTWEQTRTLAVMIVNCFTENYIYAEDLLPFTWDTPKTIKKVIMPDMDPERIAKMENMINTFYKNRN